MGRKTKVIAFRVTEEELEAIQVSIGKPVGMRDGKVISPRTVAEVVGEWIADDVAFNMEYVRKQKKAAEAKAKREAKKAANGQ